MDKLAALKLFVETVNAGGFSAAARRLGIATSSVTRAVEALEAELGVALVNRSTRRISVTLAGEAYHARALDILGAVADADALVADRGESARGPLHVSLPVEFGRRLIVPHIGAFLARHPELQLNLTLTDKIVDLLTERVDLSIRLGDLVLNDDVVLRRIGEFQRWMVASPAYLQRHPRPRVPADLAQHACLTFDYANNCHQWIVRKNDQEHSIPVRGPLRSNNGEVLRQAALDGIGIALLGDWLVRDDVASGRLCRLLDDHQVSPGRHSSPINAFFLPGQRASARIGAFIDFVVECLQDERR